jgi:hypothetical protein
MKSSLKISSIGYVLYSSKAKSYYTGKAGKDWIGPKEDAFIMGKVEAENKQELFNNPNRAFIVKDWILEVVDYERDESGGPRLKENRKVAISLSLQDFETVKALLDEHLRLDHLEDYNENGNFGAMYYLGKDYFLTVLVQNNEVTFEILYEEELEKKLHTSLDNLQTFIPILEKAIKEYLSAPREHGFDMNFLRKLHVKASKDLTIEDIKDLKYPDTPGLGFGYFGHLGRSLKTDKALIVAANEVGLGRNAFVAFLLGKGAQYMMTVAPTLGSYLDMIKFFKSWFEEKKVKQLYKTNEFNITDVYSLPDPERPYGQVKNFTPKANAKIKTFNVGTDKGLKEWIEEQKKAGDVIVYEKLEKGKSLYRGIYFAGPTLEDIYDHYTDLVDPSKQRMLIEL